MSDLSKIVQIEAGPENKERSPEDDKKAAQLAAALEARANDKWVRTKYCYCPDDAETDCRFHSSKEKGWETCPYTYLGERNKAKGRWLWTYNPKVKLDSVTVSEHDLKVGAKLNVDSMVDQESKGKRRGRNETTKTGD